MKGRSAAWWFVRILTPVSVGGAFLLSVQLDPTDKTRIRLGHLDVSRYWFWISVGVLLAVAGWVLDTAYTARAERDAEDLRREQQAEAAATREQLTAAAVSLGTAIVGPVTLLASILGELSDLQRRGKTVARAEILGRAKVTVLDGLLSVFPDDISPRTCFFQLEGEAPTRKLVSSESRGRLPATRRVFEEQTKAGDDALQALDSNRIRYWLGQESDAPAGWDASRGYHSFISVPVATKGKVFGMLTVDALPADAFTIPRDRQIVEAIARLYAAVLASP